MQEYRAVDISENEYHFAERNIKLVQRRKHKKKRINKKWAKQYGYDVYLRNDNKWELFNE
jgi:hypothetical protein